MAAASPGATEQGPNLVGTEDYAHYRREHQLADFARTRRGQGVQPGQEAPDFELEAVAGGRVRLSSLRSTPVVLHFGSLT